MSRKNKKRSSEIFVDTKMLFKFFGK